MSVQLIFIFLNRVNWVKTAGKSRWMKFELGNFLSRVEKQNQFKLYAKKKNKLFPFSNEDHHHHNAEFLTFSNGISVVNQKYICHLISNIFSQKKSAMKFIFCTSIFSLSQPYRTNRFHKNYLRTFFMLYHRSIIIFSCQVKPLHGESSAKEKWKK